MVQRLAPVFHEKIWGSRELEPWFRDTTTQTGEVWFNAQPPLPILAKFLFTNENLSVQVHPPGVKTEMWHILRAAPDSRIALGFREPVTRERLREAVLGGEIER
ncbi:MAG: phosphoheptose isomerase, partial [Bryobacteraceae bacterium]